MEYTPVPIVSLLSFPIDSKHCHGGVKVQAKEQPFSRGLFPELFQNEQVAFLHYIYYRY